MPESIYFPKTGCVNRYKSDYIDAVSGVPDGHLLSPWVSATFINNTQGQKNNPSNEAARTITVSNNSSPPNNTAVIQSFTFGREQAIVVRFVIQDQQGGSFEKFMQNMIKDMRCFSTSLTYIKFQYGWVKSGCLVPAPAQKSSVHYCAIDSIEGSITSGKFVFEITGRDQSDLILDTASEALQGENGFKGMHLKDAIVKLLTESQGPKVKNVYFARQIIANGKLERGEVEFADGEIVAGRGPKYNEGMGKGRWRGPKGPWRASSVNKLEAVQDWLKNHTSKDGHGFKPVYATEEGGTIIYWEDAGDLVGQKAVLKNIPAIGFYIVNGGKYSPVIEFNPRIKWMWGSIASVGGTNSVKKEGVESNGFNQNSREKMTKTGSMGGTMQSIPVSEDMKDSYGKDAVKEADKAQTTYSRLEHQHNPIEADLILVGDPHMIDPIWALSQYVSIAFINPFHLMPGENCGQWLASPACNSILSNSRWMIKAAQHSIEPGSFKTTLTVWLAGPPENIQYGQPLGGTSNGYVFPPQCQIS